METMSKSRALAGLPVGYAFGGVGLIEALRRVKDSFNSYPLGRRRQAGATASVHDEAYLTRELRQVVAGRRAMTRELIRLGSPFCLRARISSSPGIRRWTVPSSQRCCANMRCW